MEFCVPVAEQIGKADPRLSQRAVVGLSVVLSDRNIAGHELSPGLLRQHLHLRLDLV